MANWFNLFDFSGITNPAQSSVNNFMSGLNKPSAPTGGGLLPPTPTRQPLAPTPMQRPVQRPMQSIAPRPQAEGFSLIPKAQAREWVTDAELQEMIDAGATDDEIIQMTEEITNERASIRMEQPTQPWFLDKIGQSAEKRGSRILELQGTNDSSLEKGWQSLGQWLWFAFDFVWAGISALTPDAVKDFVKEKAKSQWDQLSPSVQNLAVSSIKWWADGWGAFEKEYPRAARNITASLQIWSAVPIGFWTKVAGEATAQIGKEALVKVWKVGTQIGKTPQLIGKGMDRVSDAIETGVEKSAGKILWSSDGTKELFKATSPSYNTLSKSKDIRGMQTKAKLADDSIIKKWFTPKNTSERVEAYNNTMKSYWADAEVARGWAKTKYNTSEIADIIDGEINKISVKWVVNPALKSDVEALMKQSEYFRWLGVIDVPTLWNQRALINSITDWGASTQFGNTFSSTMKKVAGKIRETEDALIWTMGGDAIKRYGALRSMYDDIVKQDIKVSRAKWLGIEESFARITGLSETIGWVAQIVMNPKQALPTIASGLSKVFLWKVAGKLKDTDYLIKTGYEKLLKSNNPTNGNIPRSITNKRPTEGKGWVKLLPPWKPTLRSADVVNVKPVNLPTKTNPSDITSKSKIVRPTTKGLKKADKPSILDLSKNKKGFINLKLPNALINKRDFWALSDLKEWVNLNVMANLINKDALSKKMSSWTSFFLHNQKDMLSYALKKWWHNVNLTASDIKWVYTLDNFIKHDSLFSKYPSLKNQIITLADFHTTKKRWVVIDWTIYINSKIFDKNKNLSYSTLVHEIEHKIQDIKWLNKYKDFWEISNKAEMEVWAKKIQNEFLESVWEKSLWDYSYDNPNPLNLSKQRRLHKP